MSTIRLMMVPLLLALAAPAAAQSGQSRIELEDGSRIFGSVVAVEDGGFVVESPTLGRVRIDAERIRSILPNGGARVPSAGGLDQATTDQVLGLQRQMMGDPQIMSLIGDLQHDPEVMQALADPRLMRAIVGGDLDYLRDDPGFQSLMAHPGIRAIVERVR